MDEKNPQNQQSFESGNPQDALDMIRLRLLDEQDLPSTIADLALFYEKSEDFHTAGYLYKTAIDLLPSNKEFLEARVRCEASITQKIREAETGRPRAHRLIFGFTLVIVSALIVLGSLTYFFADFADVLLDLEIRDYSVHIAVGGVFFGLIGLYHILKYITKRILHWRKVRLAQGEDFSDDRHIPCRVCTLRYKRVLTICPYCKSPQKEPQIVSQPEDNAQQEIPLTDAVQSPIIPIPEPGAIIFSATPDDITVALPKDNPFSYNPLDQKTTETVSDSPDSESKFGFIPNTARNQKNNIINNRQWLGIIGSLVLIFAVFTPIFSVGILGNISYFQNGRGDGVIVLILAIISLVIVLVRKYKVLWFTGIGIALMLTLTFIAFQIRLSNIKAEIKNQGTENMFSDTAESLTESIMMQWGCGLLIIGTILIIACAAMKDNNVEYQSVKNSSTDKNKLINKDKWNIIQIYFKIAPYLIFFIISIILVILSIQFFITKKKNTEIDSSENKTDDLYQSQPEPEIYIYNENEFFESGYLKYIVTKSWWSNRLHRNQYINQRPNAVYLFVEVAVQNIDSQPRVIPPFRLVDENDAVYSTSSNSWVVENSIGIMETLNPNVSKRGIVVFDVPKDKKYALQLLGGYWSGEAVFVLLSPKSSQTIKRPDISLDVGEL